MIYERTDDMNFVTDCLTEPSVWRLGSDDKFNLVDPDLFFVDQKINFLWLKCGEHGLLIGEPRNTVTIEAHIALLPSARGSAVEICSGAIRWLFDNTSYSCVTASVPDFNKLAIRLAGKVGMGFVGVQKGSFMKHGKLYDQHMYSINKGDVCHQ